MVLKMCTYGTPVLTGTEISHYNCQTETGAETVSPTLRNTTQCVMNNWERYAIF